MFQHPLVKEIAVVLVLKLTVLTGLWYAFFRAEEVPEATVVERLFGAEHQNDSRKPE